MLSILGFLVILAPLVIVHELGHFFFAKLFGVKAEAFSVGFGPTLIKRQWGETEFKVCAIPLGGYVKLLGQEPGVELSPAEKARSLNAAVPWKRFFIFAGGPLFNFIFAGMVFVAILVIGEPQLSAWVGRVEEGSPAAEAGFRAGDQILEMDGQPVTFFRDVVMKIHESPGHPVKFKIQRSGEASPAELTVTPTKRMGYTQYGEEKDVGDLPGLSPFARGTQIGISNPRSAAGRLGIQTGDEWVSFGGTPVTNWEELEVLYAGVRAGSTVKIQVRRDTKSMDLDLRVPVRKSTLATDFGAHSSELFVKTVMEGSPAAKAGLQVGDRVISYHGKPVASFETLKDLIQESSSGETAPPAVSLQVERMGVLQNLSVQPDGKVTRDPSLRKKVTYSIGVVPMLSVMEPKVIVERVWNPFRLLGESVARTVDYSWRNFVSIGKMVTGDVSLATLGGPILIGKIAGDSIERGLIAFLTTMAVLSIGLGVLNILPIPVLDGGHIVLLGLEVVRRKPLTLRQMELVQQVGLSLILILMVVVMRNDLTRLPFFN